MQSIQQVVEQKVMKSAFIREGMTRHVLNLSHVARSLHQEVELELKKPCSVGAITMALQRLAPKLQRAHKAAQVKLTDLSIKTGLYECNFANSSTLNTALAHFLKEVTAQPTQYTTFIKGVSQSTIIFSAGLLTLLEKHTKNEHRLGLIPHLAGVTMLLPPETLEQPGVLSNILTQLAWEGINIVEVVSTVNELTVIVADTAVEEVFRVLRR